VLYLEDARFRYGIGASKFDYCFIELLLLLIYLIPYFYISRCR